MMTSLADRSTGVKRLPKDYFPRYAAALVCSDAKEQLQCFRARTGLLTEALLERCVVTAAFELLISDPALHERWSDRFRQAVAVDCELTIKDVNLGGSACNAPK